MFTGRWGRHVGKEPASRNTNIKRHAENRIESIQIHDPNPCSTQNIYRVWYLPKFCSSTTHQKPHEIKRYKYLHRMIHTAPRDCSEAEHESNSHTVLDTSQPTYACPIDKMSTLKSAASNAVPNFVPLSSSLSVSSNEAGKTLDKIYQRSSIAHSLTANCFSP
ncbi:hypothetical protein IQ06DRAFT_91689 [Phaeosphaeriaceae sp. SRC1lsM3a]|nr:hypothetical protein IQ06DRAFT_91689 [Stagonospora sp. SRC1lsM3a]